MRTRPRLFVVLAAGLALIAPAAAVADGPDRFDPPVVEETLQAGESTTVDKTLHLTGLPPKADIILAVDTTGSMGPAIAQAKAEATQICNDVQAQIPGARFAVVDIEDYPGQPLGGPGDNAYTLLTAGYVADCASVQAALNTMVADGGGDAPEAFNREFFESYSDPVLLASRDAQAVRFNVVLGDAAPHSTPPFGACPSAPPNDLGRDNVGGTGDDLDTPETINGMVADDTILLMIHYSHAGTSTSLACYESLAQATGGDAVAGGGGAQLSDQIVQLAKDSAPEYTVDFQISPDPCPIGLAFSPPPPYGPFQGESHVIFTETITAPTTPGSYTCTITALINGVPSSAQQSVTVHVTPGPPATLTLEPATATNPVDTQHCVTATVRDEFGNPTPGITVRFSVTPTTFRSPSSGSATTDANGEAEFCYTSALPGTDTIHAYADTDGDNVQDAGEPSADATKTWTPPESTPDCKVTYGGRITAANGDKGTFGGNATAPDKGQEQYQDHGPATPMNVHSINVQAVTCSADKTQSSIFGQATIDGAGTFDYRIDLKDLSGSGTDTYRIRLSNGYDSGEQPLQGGNVVIHK